MDGGATTGSADRPLIDRATAASGVRRLLMLGGSLMVLAALLALLGNAYGGIALLIIFGGLAMAGLAAIFATALGFVQFTGRIAEASIAKDFLDTARTGMLILDRKGRIIYANKAYGEMTGASSAADIRTVENLLSDVPEALSTIYRLASGLIDGQEGDGEGQALLQPP